MKRDPVVFFEPKRVYRAAKGEVPEGDYRVPLSKAWVARPGRDITVLAYGAMLYEALDAAAKASKQGVECEVIDLRTLWPVDVETIIDSVKKTGRIAVVHEAPRTGGFASELITLVCEKAFYHLQAAPLRITGFDTPFPYALEAEYMHATLASYASGIRPSGIMQPVAAGLETGEIDMLASHFAGLDGMSGDAACAGPEKPGRGAVLARHGDPDRKIPACNACHGGGAGHRNPMYPGLAGQPADYLSMQLELFRERSRGGTDHAPLMHSASKRLTDRDIRDLAGYYAALPGGCPVPD